MSDIAMFHQLTVRFYCTPFPCLVTNEPLTRNFPFRASRVVHKLQKVFSQPKVLIPSFNLDEEGVVLSRILDNRDTHEERNGVGQDNASDRASRWEPFCGTAAFTGLTSLNIKTNQNHAAGFTFSAVSARRFQPRPAGKF
jgi:hypothetical protein